jgi:signal transduction histidine kinase
VDLAHALADQAAVALENARLYQDAEQRRQEAETANRAKDEFLAMLGHELRNPLGAIANAVGVLDRTRDDAEVARRAHEIIDRQVNHLARLVDDLLDVGRVVTGKIVLERRPLDLAAAVSSAVSTLVAGAPPGPRVVLETSPVWIDADTTRVEQVAVNLVSNALKYTPSHGTVRVSVARDGEHAVLRVQDDGIGMSPELLARVFDLFVQGMDPGAAPCSPCAFPPWRLRTRPTRRTGARHRRLTAASSSSRTTTTRARCCATSWRCPATRSTRRATGRPAWVWRSRSALTSS